MSVSLSFQKFSSGQMDVVRSSMPLPIVYEHVPVAPSLWEYHMLTIDLREEAIPDIAQLNELGNAGWLLVDVLHQEKDGRTSLVHYYFVRQKVE